MMCAEEAIDLRSFASVAEAGWGAPGQVSTDETAVVGHDKWIYLYRGGNEYYAAYQEGNSEADKADAQAWGRYIAYWQRHCGEKGRRFAALIIPNKASVLPEHYPLPMSSDLTLRMRYLLAEAGDQLLFPLDAICDASLREVVFRRNDSHLTDAGSIFLSNFILEHFGLCKLLPILGGSAQIRNLLHPGDLGRRFLGEYQERVYRLARDLSSISVEQLNEPNSRTGFVGLSYRTRNLRAPIKKRMLVFGNSFFEKVPSWGMAPDFALVFEEVVFVWTEKLDQETIDSADPDYVLLQTCERFLGRRPHIEQ